MKLKIALYTVSIILLTAFQNYIEIFGVNPNIVLAFVICVAVAEKPVTAGVVGLICGVIIDLLSSYRFGYNSLMFMYLAIFASILRLKYFVPGGFISGMFAFAGALVHGVVFYFFYIFLWNDVGFVSPFVKEILPGSLYTSVITLFMYPFFSYGKKKTSNG